MLDLRKLAIRRQLGSLNDWLALLNERPETYNRSQTANMLARMRGAGVVNSFGYVAGKDITQTGDNLRDQLSVGGRSPRVIALTEEIMSVSKPDDRILLFEAITPFADFMRGKYRYIATSEFAPRPEEAAEIFPHPHIDMMDIPFGDGAFDLTVCSDVLEHVPDIDKALSERARVTRPGGVMLSTFPFASKASEGIRKASISAGEIIYHAEPEYHGDPVRPSAGVLVFEIPAWDIIGRAKAAGFSSAHMIYLSDHHRGIIAGDVDGIFVLKAVR